MAEADVNIGGKCKKTICDNKDSYEDDDEEFGCDEDELTQTFNVTCERLKTTVNILSPEQMLEFYAFYKQATVGPCTAPRPSWYAFEAKQKWESWTKLGDMSKTDAMSNYIRLAKKYMTDDNKNLDESKAVKSGWVAVSSMANGDVHLNDEDKTIFDWVKENNLKKIRQLIRGRDVGSKDSDGMGLIHWAADRGSFDIIKFLVDEMNADIEMRDADGQTALHYAASCGHKDVLKFLINKGASKNVTDNDGISPKEVASDRDIENILS